ncbi:helix-turn-helix domain-containing protein [Leisingera sp. M523]|uniref:helix-turn-helix domain-containing protein n=1 Tax=Leisingera sp. M523 TaxID=2867013 RepID=UPI0021A5DAB8|nr:helix-turn-helix transcriptional regulator [Leisingera sp. M523]UWQ28864.1 helix-turn-helix domain-containing protein [Leisingera sp. M523]
MTEAIQADLDNAVVALQKQIGANLRALRESRELTQDDLAHSAGLATRHLQKIESGQINVTIRTLARLGFALGIRPELFFSERKEFSSK